MKFLIDINIAASVSSFLQRNHHDLVELRKKGLLKLPDRDVINIAKGGNRIILTHDKDFIRLTSEDSGFICIVVRLKRQIPDKVIKNLEKLFQKEEFNNLKSGLVVVKEEGIDISKT